MAVSLRVVTEALRELTVPAEVTAVSQASCEDVLLQTLSRKLAAHHEKLQQDPVRLALGKLRSSMLAQLAWPMSSDDVVWSFVAELLVLLLCLKQTMIDVLAQFTPPKPNPKSPECAPPLSPDTLSILQQKTVQSALQFVVTLGICSHLLPGVGIPLGCRSEFAATVEKVVGDSMPASGTWRLLNVTQVLLSIAEHPSLESLVFTRHLGDLMASLCQLSYSSTKDQRKASPGHIATQKGLTEEEQRACQESLRKMLDQVYQPNVIKELLILQRGAKVVRARGGSARTMLKAPAWLRRVCGQFLSQALMKPHGVQAVVRGIVEGAGAGPAGGECAEAVAADWRKCDTVARILASCPQQCLCVGDYYRHVCPQVLELLHIRDALTARQFQRVATTTLLSMVREQPELAAEHLLGPLLAPLVTCLRTRGMGEESGKVDVVLLGELELTRCVEDVYKVCVVGNDPVPRLMESVQMVIPAVFNLHCFTKQGVSHLRSACLEIILWFLQKSEKQIALVMLKRLAGLLPMDFLLQPLYRFTAGSEGGVRLVAKEQESDDDEALYGKVCWEQWRAECLADVLSSLQESSIAGDFFIECLKGLASFAGENDCSPGCTGAVPDLEQQQLITVQLVAVMCERIGHSVFSNTVQMIEFIMATLKRSCTSLVHRTEEVVEAQTLSMGMGLVAAMLGGAVQLTASDFVALRPMLPLLEQLSALHPDPVVQELASDLRITIATRGAFSSETVSKAAHTTMGKKTQRVSRSTGGGRAEEAGAGTRDREVPSLGRPGNPEYRNNSTSDFQDILQAAFDPEESTRAAALRTLTRMIQQRNPDAQSNQEKVLTVFLENLNHEDSFVYLSAIQGLSVLSDVYPARILPQLLNEYQVSSQEAEKPRSVETRMKIGEVLMRSTRALGEMASHYRDQLIHVYLMGTKDVDSCVRASSLSNLGELCTWLDFALGPVIHEVTACLSAIVKTEREAEVRRAAVHVVTLLLRGLCEKALQVLADVLLELYRLLKFAVQTDVDQLVQLHAQLALEELDCVVRGILFPEEKLEKKITVLP
ncbi:transport and Golgi organization protein 6 homolog [Leucoraja erinacea]|uniref:transport and Golgi organization protein 6 homolog n=1 Tax=Leucoraja erinaceus TaxID=7782 RepID=UPI0024549CBB|nr:transport and Golgi organization protein 6 homolog [Leucoraja erinacea]